MRALSAIRKAVFLGGLLFAAIWFAAITVLAPGIFAFSGIEKAILLGGLMFMASVTITFRVRSKLKPWLLYHFEHRVSHVTFRPKNLQPRLIALPWTQALLFALGFLSLAVSDRTIISISSVALILMFVGLAAHFWPGFPRKVKYEIFVLGLALLTSLTDPFSLIFPFGYFTLALVILILQLAARFICADFFGQAFLQRIHRIVLGGAAKFLWLLAILFVLSVALANLFERHQLLTLVVVPIIPLLLITFLVIRYINREVTAANPIIYLRAFSYQEGPDAFGSIVAPIASVHAPVLALVHESQSAAELNRSIGPLKQARTEYVSDEHWRERLTELIRHARYVVIDYTVETQSIAWEFDTARKFLTGDSILVLYAQGRRPPNTPGVSSIEYGMTKSAKSKASALVRQWFSSRGRADGGT